MSKAELIVRMTEYLESACACLAVGDRKMFYFNAGKAEAIDNMLGDLFLWDVEDAAEHIHNMLDIIDENW